MLKLTVAEANCLADINNPGFGGALYHGIESTIPSALLLNVMDTFLELYPGKFGEKWEIDESALLKRLQAADEAELMVLAIAITQFWDDAAQESSYGKMMDAYFPCEKEQTRA